MKPFFDNSTSDLKTQVNNLVGNESDLDRLKRDKQNLRALQLATDVLTSLGQMGDDLLNKSIKNEVRNLAGMS